MRNNAAAMQIVLSRGEKKRFRVWSTWVNGFLGL